MGCRILQKTGKSARPTVPRVSVRRTTSAGARGAITSRDTSRNSMNSANSKLPRRAGNGAIRLCTERMEIVTMDDLTGF